MKILEFSYKNILSYGNKIQKFTFDDKPKLILIEGENGSGKSSIKEALTISIYGKSAIRSIKDIPNWINKNAYTSINFIDNLGRNIKLERGIDPNFSNLTIDGVSYNLPDKKKVDLFVEEELVKIPFNVFCNTISLSFDDFKSFVSLSQADKRKIVDRIFGIDILFEMRTIVKEEFKENKRLLDSINLELSNNKSLLESSILKLNELKQKILKNNELKIDEIENKIRHKNKLKEQLKEKYNSLISKLQEYQNNLNNVRDSLSKSKHSILDLSEKLDIYKNNVCPHCLNDLTTNSSLQIKEKLEQKKNELESQIPELKQKFNELQNKINNIMDLQSNIKSEFKVIESDINRLKEDLIKSSKNEDNEQTDSINSIINDINLKIEECNNKIKQQMENNEIYYILDELLSESGIKKRLIDKIIPILNNKIKEISEKLDFKFIFEFDNEFNPIISYLGMNISPESLSSGQRKKMNLIVILAFIELIKMKHNKMNIMFLDEIFSSLDKNNVYKSIEILKQYSEKYNMTIFVVSHESLPEEFFDYKILVKNKEFFSDIEIVSN